MSIGWMVVEATGSIAFGLAAGSLALLAFGGDSLIELISGLAVLVHLRRDAAGSEANDGTATGRITSALLFALIPVIGFGAGYSYFTGIRPEGSPPGMAVAICAVIIMPFLWLEKSKIGRETRSLPLSIDAIESITCFFMSIAALVGLVAEYLGFWWVDYFAAGVILAFVMKEAVESYHEVKEEGEQAVLIGLQRESAEHLSRYITLGNIPRGDMCKNA